MGNENFCGKIERDSHGCVLACNGGRLPSGEGYWESIPAEQGGIVSLDAGA